MSLFSIVSLSLSLSNIRTTLELVYSSLFTDATLSRLICSTGAYASLHPPSCVCVFCNSNVLHCESEGQSRLISSFQLHHCIAQTLCPDVGVCMILLGLHGILLHDRKALQMKKIVQNQEKKSGFSQLNSWTESSVCVCVYLSPPTYASS